MDFIRNGSVNFRLTSSWARIILDSGHENKINRAMNSRTLRRKPVTIANSRWATYALAGAATSLAVLATAEAEIHYSGPVSFRFTGTLHAQFPLDNGASLDFF